MAAKQCFLCDESFECRVTSPGELCWCAGYPAVLPAGEYSECLCPRCLSLTIADLIEKMAMIKSHEEMLELASRSHSDDNMIENIDYYIENNCYVFSRWYHLKRGRCCGNECRHCPFGSP